jgi:hypothetical protein
MRDAPSDVGGLDMRRYLSAAMLAALAVAGCAGPGALGRSGAVVPAAGYGPGDLGGTWEGSYGWPGGSYWPNDGHCTVRINGDGTFTATVVPIPGANNLAKRSTWSGTVDREGNLVAFRVPQGLTLTLRRSGDRLYGVARDPAIGVPLVVELERAAHA